MTTAAEQSLTDALMNAPIIMTPTRARHVLRTLAATENHDALVRWLGDTLGLDALVRAVLDSHGPDSIVRSLGDVGALTPMRATLADSEPGDERQLYAINREGERG